MDKILAINDDSLHCGATSQIQTKVSARHLCLILVFLIAISCRQKVAPTPATLKRMFLDSVFTDLKIAEQNKLNVYHLRLWEAGLQKFPQSVLEFKHIRTLSLDMNLFDSIPSQISQLGDLEVLSACNSPLKYIPESIGQLSSLRELSILDTDVANLPESIGDLKNLERLSLGLTRITTLPKSIVNLKKLKSLSVSGPDGEMTLSKTDQAHIVKNLPSCRISFGGPK